MQMRHITYNARRRVFTAQVGFWDEGLANIVACEIPADPGMRPERVMRFLGRRARKVAGL